MAAWLSAVVALHTILTRPAFALDPSRDLEQYARERWAARDSVVQGGVLSFTHGHDGYLWLGTQSTLARFDGSQFVVFESGTRGLGQYSFVRELFEDAAGSVWAAAVGGVIRHSDGQFRVFDQNHGLKHPFVYSVVEDHQGRLWAGTGGSGVWLLDTGRFSKHPAYTRPGLPAQINDMTVALDGTLWLATDDGVVQLSEPVTRYGRAEGLPSAVVHTLEFDANGALWAGTRRGLAVWRGEDFEVVAARPQLTHDGVTALLSDSNDNLWVGTEDGGVHRLNASGLARPRVEPSDGRVCAIFEDRHGALWVGTLTGMERISDGAFVTAGEAQGFAADRMFNVTPRAAGGVWVLDGRGAISVFERGRVRQVAPPGTIAGEGMLDMLETDDGSLWVAGRQLHQYTDGQWRHYRKPGGEFTTLTAIDGGLLAVQTQSNGVSTLSRLVDGRFEPIPIELPIHHVQRVVVDELGLWISTSGDGLVHLGDAGLTQYLPSDGLPHDVVYGLERDENGELWIATRGGLARLSIDGVIHSYAGVEGTPQRAPVQLRLDGAGFLWVSADDGIHRLPLSQLREVGATRGRVASVRYTQADGLHSLETSWRASAVARTQDGRLWFATSRGLSVIQPSAVPFDVSPPPVQLEKLLLGGQRVALGSRISPEQRGEHVSIEYSSPSIARLDRIDFRYRLTGFDQEWLSVGQETVARYTQLPAGEYLFEVGARRNGGEWGTASQKMRLVVEPFWHETRLAQAAFIGGLCLLLLGLYKLRVRQLQQRERELVEKVQERTAALSKEVADRREAEHRVRELNEELEGRVNERTFQLATMNEALLADVSRRQKAEAELASEKERLAVTLGSLSEGVIATDVDGNVVLMNAVAEQLTGSRGEDGTGRPIAEILSLVERGTQSSLPNPAVQVLGTAPGARSEVVRALLDVGASEQRLVDVSAAPIFDERERLVGAVLVLRDVTERTHSEERLNKAQRLESLGVLAGGIAHDFNNLLTGVFCHVDMARRNLEQDAPARRWLDDTMTVLDNARGLARQLLTFSSGGGPTLSSHSLGHLLQASARFVLSGSNVTAQLSIPDDLWPCDVDPIQIRQVVDNLVLNARQAMPEGGRVFIHAENVDSEPRQVEIRISDEGSGIPQDVADRVFDPFFTTKDTGSGLGLATVHSIVEKHGGTVELGAAEGGGAQFRIRLLAADEPSVSIFPAAAAEVSEFVQARVLVMDDDPAIRRVAEFALTQAGHEVVTAVSGEAAIELLRELRDGGRGIDVAILDLTVVGGMGGAAALSGLKEIEPRVRAIASSGYSSGTVMGDPKTHGFDGALPKPYTVEELLAVVAAMIPVE